VVVEVANAEGVTVLFDGRMGFDGVDAILEIMVTPQPTVAAANRGVNLHGIGTSGADGNGS
jgi:hypothetical protein